jgi:hypothetical protein
MTTSHRRARIAAVALAFAAAACSSAGGLGNILGGVLGQQQQNQLSGTVQGLDTRNQQIGLQQSNGQTVALAYDNNTKVVYQDRVYNVTSLDPGDQVVARIQSTNSGAYYTDSVVVTQPVNGSTNTGSTSSSSGVVQSLQGTVRAVDRNAGVFTMDAGTNVTLTVSLPYNANRTDVTKFQNLRSGDYVRLQGVYLNNSRVELRQFY